MKHDERDSAAGWTKSGSRDAGGDAARGSAACSGRGDAGCSSLEFGNVPEQCGPLDEDVSREGEAGLASRKATGRPPSLTRKQRAQLYRWIVEKNPRQFHRRSNNRWGPSELTAVSCGVSSDTPKSRVCEEGASLVIALTYATINTRSELEERNPYHV